ncbi:MAG: flagellar basal body P-ring protein FlgI [Spirochaetes bacterium]|nr:flagellar basal body P-ring protein FlgI [Spirochaetota bacterium]
MKHFSLKIWYVIVVIIFCATSLEAEVPVKIKDLVTIDGLKENQVYGYGLVIGLQGTGDSKVKLTQSSLSNVLKNLGLNDENINSKNIAAVLVTATLPPYVRVGDRIDVTVSSIGDAKSLENGVLLQSALKGADDITYVVAQGVVSIAGDKRKGGTIGRIVSGGIVEKEILPEIVKDGKIRFSLLNFDFSVAREIKTAIEKKYPDSQPLIDKGFIQCTIPQNVSATDFIAEVENIEIVPVYSARVVINERNGTIVMGGDIRVSQAVISKQGITITIEETRKKGSMYLLKDAATVKDLVDSLNYIGMSTQDIIAILKAMKQAGCLHAELIVQ